MIEIPMTLEELCDYILENAERIYVREKVEGKWGAYALTELPPKLAIKHALRFIKEGIIPCVVKEEDEEE